MLIVAVLALVAFAALPGAASAFDIANFALTPSNTQAAGHPDVTIKFDRTGTESEDLNAMNIELPPGLLANPESANPKCTDAQFNADGCPANSQVGTLSYKFTVHGSFDVTVPGTVYMLDPAATDTATVGFVLRPPTTCIFFVCAVPQKIFQKTAFRLQTMDNGVPVGQGASLSNEGMQKVANVSIPLLFVSPSFSTDITVKSVKVVLQGKSGPTGTGKYFTVNTSDCSPALTKATITSYSNVAASATSTFTPTGCPAVPFDPSVEFAPQDTSAGKSTWTSFTLNVPSADAPIQNAPPRAMKIAFPSGAGLGDSLVPVINAGRDHPCTDALLYANNCPPESVVGLAAAYSDFLPPNLVGGVYVTGPFVNAIPIAARLAGPRGTTVIVRLTLGVEATGIVANFAQGPQLPYNKFQLALLPLYKNPDLCGNQTTTATITGWNGAQVSRSTTYATTNCQPPTTTLTGPSGTITTNSATWSFVGTPNGVSFKCSLDNAPETACSSPYTASNLTPGPHTFKVYGVNGTVAGAAESRTVTYQPPAATLTAAIAPTTTQAAAHPGLNGEINISNGQMRNIDVTMPFGFQASEAAVPKCPLANATAGTCPASSKIGTAQVTANTAGG
ncbi:MAG: hypothetical protein ACRDKI_12855, partial [Solirubrobacterales bacterium]